MFILWLLLLLRLYSVLSKIWFSLFFLKLFFSIALNQYKYIYIYIYVFYFFPFWKPSVLRNLLALLMYFFFPKIHPAFCIVSLPVHCLFSRTFNKSLKHVIMKWMWQPWPQKHNLCILLPSITSHFLISHLGDVQKITGGCISSWPGLQNFPKLIKGLWHC